VEGYTDVISLHQAGIENVVASGGTALTPDQLRLVQKYSNNLTILYDGDTAGVKAALRGLDLAIEEGLNVRLVLLPDGHDPDSFVNKEGAAALRDFIQRNKKDFILFQLDVALQDAGNDPVRKAAVVNRIAETISRMNKAEDFTRRQDYIRQCAQLLKIDEAGMHALVNRFIRDRITAQERKAIATDEREAAVKSEAGAAADYDDSTYLLLFKDELQEKEVARILLEYGQTVWDESRSVADYIFEELGDESLIDNQDVIRLIRHYRDTYREQRDEAASGWFVYHSDPQLSAFAVSLLNMPYEQSDHWRREFSQSTGYQPQLFGLDYEAFMKTIARENADTLMGYLKAEEQRSNEAVASALRYLKLRKIKRMLLENQQDMEKEQDPEEFRTLHQTHEHLKKMEVALTRSNGTVILR
jgi:DNA primase